MTTYPRDALEHHSEWATGFYNCLKQDTQTQVSEYFKTSRRMSQLRLFERRKADDDPGECIMRDHLLRHRVIDPLGITSIELLSALSQQRAPGRLRNVGPQRPLLGWTLIAIAIIAIVELGFLPTEKQDLSNVVKFCVLLILMARFAFQPSADAALGLGKDAVREAGMPVVISILALLRNSVRRQSNRRDCLTGLSR